MKLILVTALLLSSSFALAEGQRLKSSGWTSVPLDTSNDPIPCGPGEPCPNEGDGDLLRDPQPSRVSPGSCGRLGCPETDKAKPLAILAAALEDIDLKGIVNKEKINSVVNKSDVFFTKYEVQTAQYSVCVVAQQVELPTKIDGKSTVTIAGEIFYFTVNTGACR